MSVELDGEGTGTVEGKEFASYSFLYGSCTPVLFRTNYYSIEIPHGVTAISLTYQSCA